MEHRPPNVVLFLTDDQGWGDLSRNGNTNLSTPRIDALAASGASLESLFVQPLCAPTRAEILTGRYFPRTGVRGVTRRAECLNLDEVTVADVFREAGYATGCFGKWHSGSAYPYHPNGRGFDEFYGFCCGHWSHYFDSTLERNGREEKASGFIVDALTDEAIQFIERNRTRPFFCYVPCNTPHSPFQVPDRFFDTFRDADIEMRHRDPEKEDLDVTRSVLAMCENIDMNVGRIVDHLDRLDLTNDTICIYLSDNGPNSFRWNGGMRGRKGSTDEGGVRSPASITWPGRIRGDRHVKQIAGAIDLFPTLVDLAGIPMIETNPLDGMSIRPVLEGSDCAFPDRKIFAQSADGATTGVRTQTHRAGGHAQGLFDLRMDIGQYEDLRSSDEVIYRELMREIEEWRETVLPAEPSERPLPVGYREFPIAYLNAQDGLPSGEITWSSVHPNASFFVDWTSTDDVVNWQLDVKTAGTYRATLMYTCEEGNAGCEMEISATGRSCSQVVSKAFDPTVKDEEDRVQRNESYEKEFHPLLLGEIGLDRGRQDISLRAKSKIGTGIVDVRSIRLELVI